MDEHQDTKVFSAGLVRTTSSAEVLLKVYKALSERGYDPVAQLSGYLLSGDPTYITAHQGARSLVHHFDRSDLLVELVRSYLVANKLTETQAGLGTG